MSLIRSTTQSLDRPGDQPVSGRNLPRPVQRQVGLAHGRGVVAATRVNAAAFVARTAMVQVALLSNEEEQLIQFAPLAESRMKAIGDTFAFIATQELANLAR